MEKRRNKKKGKMRKGTRGVGVGHAADGGVRSRVEGKPEAALLELLIKRHEGETGLDDTIEIFLQEKEVRGENEGKGEVKLGRVTILRSSEKEGTTPNIE